MKRHKKLLLALALIVIIAVALVILSFRPNKTPPIHTTTVSQSTTQNRSLSLSASYLVSGDVFLGAGNR